MTDHFCHCTAGYIGYDEAGLLTESVRRRPYQVLLLDEFEKAHPDVWNVLLQLFDEGHLTDSHGRKVDFRNCIVVMTSNMGAHLISELAPHLKGSEPEVTAQIMDYVRHQLSPELLNRIDDSIIFNRLQRENMDEIAEIGIAEIAARLEDGQNMTLDVSPIAKSVLSEMGYDGKCQDWFQFRLFGICTHSKFVDDDSPLRSSSVEARAYPSIIESLVAFDFRGFHP